MPSNPQELGHWWERARQPWDEDDDEFEASLEPFAHAVRAALAEAGHPDAHVWIEPTGVFADGAPQDVIDRAMEVCGGA